MLVAAGGAGPVGSVGMGFVLALDICLAAFAAFVIRRAEIILAGETPVGHDIQTIPLRGIGVVGVVDIGVAFCGIEVITVYTHHDAYMGEDLGEEDITGLGGVIGTVVVGNVEITWTGVSHSTEFND